MPGPYKSILNDHRKEIAELRKTNPPTPYSRIAEILKENHGIVIRASSIWSFVKARSIEGARKLKYVIADDPAETVPAKPSRGVNAKKERPIYEPEPQPKTDPYAP